MTSDMPQAQAIAVRSFCPEHWSALWALRRRQLAEHGIIVSVAELPEHPCDVDRDDFEWDYHHLDEVYFSGAGGFWIAWCGETPAGHIGAQDLGGVIELRRMYVRSDCRRRGIGTLLVDRLIEHCAAHGLATIELWTAHDGPGRRLYETRGFYEVHRPPSELRAIEPVTNYTPSAGEIRMRWSLLTTGADSAP